MEPIPLLGLDLVRIPRVEAMLLRWGKSFLSRCFTPGEISYCEARPRRRAVHYAGRIAAKEATAKALGTGLARGVGWREIEVERPPGGAPRILLHGAAKKIALENGVRSISLSITHDADLAAAVVVLHTSVPPSPVENPYETPRRARRVRREDRSEGGPGPNAPRQEKF